MGPKDFIMMPNGSQGNVGEPVEVCVSLHRYASPHHHRPKPVMLNDVAAQLLQNLSRLLHVLKVNLLSSVEEIGHRQWTSRFWYPPVGFHSVR